MRELCLVLVVAVVIAVVVKSFVAQAFYIPSGSMLPQLQIGDRVVVSKLAYELHDPNRGDIVVFDNPRPSPSPPEPLAGRLARSVLEAIGVSPPSTEEFIKRVIGLPGEVVEGRGGTIYVNGLQMVEPYLPPGTITADFGPVTVPEGHLWVMGDNRSSSSDSRVFGPIRESTVVGRAVVRVWPLRTAAFL